MYIITSAFINHSQTPRNFNIFNTAISRRIPRFQLPIFPIKTRRPEKMANMFSSAIAQKNHSKTRLFLFLPLSCEYNEKQGNVDNSRACLSRDEDHV